MGGPKSGFGSMDPERQRELARLGGKAAHRKGAGGHEWTSVSAKEAGIKGRQARAANRALHGQATKDQGS